MAHTILSLHIGSACDTQALVMTQGKEDLLMLPTVKASNK